MVMRNITNPKLLYAKGALLLLCGVLAAALLLFEHPELKTAALLALAVWCFARAYYFAFYVVEHYADPGFHFAGLGSFVVYMLRRRRSHMGRD
jgi:type IV secretory pathway TrbD component